MSLTNLMSQCRRLNRFRSPPRSATRADTAIVAADQPPSLMSYSVPPAPVFYPGVQPYFLPPDVRGRDPSSRNTLALAALLYSLPLPLSGMFDIVLQIIATNLNTTGNPIPEWLGFMSLLSLVLFLPGALSAIVAIVLGIIALALAHRYSGGLARRWMAITAIILSPFGLLSLVIGLYLTLIVVLTVPA